MPLIDASKIGQDAVQALFAELAKNAIVIQVGGQTPYNIQLDIKISVVPNPPA